MKEKVPENPGEPLREAWRCLVKLKIARPRLVRDAGKTWRDAAAVLVIDRSKCLGSARQTLGRCPWNAASSRARMPSRVIGVGLG
jgi:hypothetical protein